MTMHKPTPATPQPKVILDKLTKKLWQAQLSIATHVLQALLDHSGEDVPLGAKQHVFTALLAIADTERAIRFETTVPSDPDQSPSLVLKT